MVKPKPHDAGVYETPMPDDFKIVGDDWAPLDDAKSKAAMPRDCPTPKACREHCCHGACLPASEVRRHEREATMTMRQRFEAWARDADLRTDYANGTWTRNSESPLDRLAYESRDTAIAWEAWKAASAELDH